MDDLDLAEVQNQLGDDFRPTDDQYSIVLIDRRLPLSDPECATKGYEADDSDDDLPLPDALEMAIVAIRNDGAVIELA